MMCRDVLAVVEGFVLRELPQEESLEVDRHLEACGACRDIASDTRFLVGTLEQLQEPTSVSMDGAERLQPSPISRHPRLRLIYAATAALLIGAVPGLWLVLRSSADPVPVQVESGSLVDASSGKSFEGPIPQDRPLEAFQDTTLTTGRGDRFVFSSRSKFVFENSTALRLERGTLEWFAVSPVTVRVREGAFRATGGHFKVRIMMNSLFSLTLIAMSGRVEFSPANGSPLFIGVGQALTIYPSGTWELTIPQDEVDELIKKLGAGELATRDRAEQKLMDLGTTNLPRLKKAATETKDAWTQERLDKIVKRLEAWDRALDDRFPRPEALKDSLGLNDAAFEKVRKEHEQTSRKVGDLKEENERLKAIVRPMNSGGPALQEWNAAQKKLEENRKTADKLLEDLRKSIEELLDPGQRIKLQYLLKRSGK